MATELRGVDCTKRVGADPGSFFHAFGAATSPYTNPIIAAQQFFRLSEI